MPRFIVRKFFSDIVNLRRDIVHVEEVLWHHPPTLETAGGSNWTAPDHALRFMAILAAEYGEAIRNRRGVRCKKPQADAAEVRYLRPVHSRGRIVPRLQVRKWRAARLLADGAKGYTGLPHYLG